MAAAPAVDRSFAGPGRLAGVDLARGLAVLGMLAAHLIDLPAWDASDPTTWIDLASGRSSILFATLAGVSIALVSGGADPLPRGRRLRTVRGRLVVRAILLWIIGLLLIATGVPVYVILPSYAILFLLGIALLRLPARALWSLAAVLALVMPWGQPALDALPIWQGAGGEDLVLALGWHYPATVWCAFLVAGLAAGRSDLSARTTQGRLLLVGGALAVIGYGTDALVGALPGVPATEVASVLTARPHSNGLFEVIGSGGFALAVIALCQLACRVPALGAVALPLRAVGSMPLTAYVGQILVWAVLAAALFGDTGDLGAMRSLHPFWPFALGTVAFCTAWALFVGRGPLERVVAGITRTLVRTGPRGGVGRLAR